MVGLISKWRHVDRLLNDGRQVKVVLVKKGKQMDRIINEEGL